MAFDNQDNSCGLRKVRQAIAKLHSYELPECICLTVEDGSPNYLAWIAESVAAADEEGKFLRIVIR